MTECKIVDIVYYNSGYLMIVSFYEKGTTWYAPIPCMRDQIGANLKGQKALSLGDDVPEEVSPAAVGAFLVIVALIAIAIFGFENVIGILIILAPLFGLGKSE